MNTPTFSIVIPCHNEAPHVGGLLQKVERVFADTLHETIVVLDGCTDGTEDVVREMILMHPSIRALVNQTRLGKGGAIRRGVESARGDAIGFIDGDGEIEPSYLRNAFSSLEKEKADIVIGTRRGKDAAYHTTLCRHLTSWGYQTAVWALFGLRLTDTQCGLKAFTSECAKRVFTLSNVNGYAFDIDVLLHAFWSENTIVEIPIVQRFKGASTITFRHVLEMVRDTCYTYDRHVHEIFARSGAHRTAHTAHVARSLLFLPFTTIIAFALGIALGSRK